MPASMAECIKRTAARSVFGRPTCQPPRPRTETRSPVRPKGLVGISTEDFDTLASYGAFSRDTSRLAVASQPHLTLQLPVRSDRRGRSRMHVAVQLEFK